MSPMKKEVDSPRRLMRRQPTREAYRGECP